MLALYAGFVVGTLAASSSSDLSGSTCADVKALYKEDGCCGNPDKLASMQLVPKPRKSLSSANTCAGTKVELPNTDCTAANFDLPQAGADVTAANVGTLTNDATPIATTLFEAGLCPVNVHWHLGAEHRSEGQYDENGTGPSSRRLAAAPRQGHRCMHYNSGDARFTTEYNWQHCLGMKVGETYEVHWPHSKAGACGTPDQFQTPFYDGVFCRHGTGAGQVNLLAASADTGDHTGADGLATKVGVEAQVFTIINDEDYYYPDLMRGMIVDGQFGADIAKYAGSTTGDSRNNTNACSQYSPISWHVDRKCHLISASTFDKMCADMKQVRDDMTSDLHAHGARETVADSLYAAP